MGYQQLIKANIHVVNRNCSGLAGIALIVIGALVWNSSIAAPWAPAELEEEFMRSLARSQCVEKTLETFRLRCGDEPKCLTSYAGVMGDCIAWASDNTGPMCAYLPSRSAPQCRAQALSPLQCRLLDQISEGFCNGSIPDESVLDLPANELFQSVAPSIVVVLGLDAMGEVISQGSGVVVEPTVVASNCHVLYGSQRPAVRYKNSHHQAKIKHTDIERDVCTLTVETLTAPQVRIDPLIPRSLAIGDKVYAIGAPRGLELSLSDGLISGFRQEPEGTYIQTTAPISPGSSGGGLFDARGRLLGLTTLYLADSQQLNFAVPVNWISELPVRSARPENIRAERRYAREALNRLEVVLRRADPFYPCKRELVLPIAKANRANARPITWPDMFLRLYENVDAAACSQ